LAWLGLGLGALIAIGAISGWLPIGGRCPSCPPAGIEGIPLSNFIVARDAETVETFFGAQGFDVASVGSDALPRLYVRALPSDLETLADVDRRKRVFVLIVLPQVLRLNEAILADRDRLRSLWARMDAGGDLPAPDRRWIAATETRYGVRVDDRDTLLRRLDIVPPSLALAQASIESGWGTSRFAQAGNAIFGQRTFDPEGKGLDPADIDDPDFKVKKFPSLMRSIWGYMLTLNAHPAHRGFREMRAQSRRKGHDLNSIALAATLTRYSEDGETYVDLVQEVITVNNFQRFDSLPLADAR